MKVEARAGQPEAHQPALRQTAQDSRFRELLADPDSRAFGFAELGIWGAPGRHEGDGVQEGQDAGPAPDMLQAAAALLGAQALALALPEITSPAALSVHVGQAALSAIRDSAVIASGDRAPTAAVTVAEQAEINESVDLKTEMTATASAPAQDSEAQDRPVRVELATIDGELHFIVFAKEGVKIDKAEIERIFSRMINGFGVTSPRLSFRLPPVTR